MPRFVVLHHELPADSGRASHFDLMIEQGGSLRTWALDAWPPHGGESDAQSLPDHRLEYLDYEGPVSEDRGRVTRVAQGTCEILTSGEAAWSLKLDARDFRGWLELRRLGDERWVARGGVGDRLPGD